MGKTNHVCEAKFGSQGTNLQLPTHTDLQYNSEVLVRKVRKDLGSSAWVLSPQNCARYSKTVSVKVSGLKEGIISWKNRICQ